MTKVFTSDEWLMHAFNGFRNSAHTAKIEVVFDLYDRPIIGTSILDDKTWNLQTQVTHPQTKETKPLIEWLTLIDYEPKPQEDIEI